MRPLITALCAALLLAGCGVATRTVTVTTPRTAAGVADIPAGQISVPPETARIPDGAEPQVLAHRHVPEGTGLTVSLVAVSNAGVNLVGGFEGFSSCPYWDAYGRVYTRGYGETDFGGNFGGRCITRSFGLYNLRRLLNVSYLWPVRQLGGQHFNQCQVDAMASASYNLGPGILTGHAASLRAHNAYFLLGYVHAGGVTLAGLVRRRRAEVNLFYSHRCGTPPAPESRAHKSGRLHATEHKINQERVYIRRHLCVRHNHRTDPTPHTAKQVRICRGVRRREASNRRVTAALRRAGIQ